jgi:hypothetical protein
MEATVLVMPKSQEEKSEKRERGSGRIWQRGPFYWIQYYDAHGRQVRESLHSDTLTVARRLLKRRLGQKEAGLLPDRTANRVAVQDLADIFLLDYKNNGKSLRWANHCWDDLKPFFWGNEGNARHDRRYFPLYRKAAKEQSQQRDHKQGTLMPSEDVHSRDTMHTRKGSTPSNLSGAPKRKQPPEWICRGRSVSETLRQLQRTVASCIPRSCVQFWIPGRRTPKDASAPD